MKQAGSLRSGALGVGRGRCPDRLLVASRRRCRAIAPRARRVHSVVGPGLHVVGGRKYIHTYINCKRDHFWRAWQHCPPVRNWNNSHVVLRMDELGGLFSNRICTIKAVVIVVMPLWGVVVVVVTCIGGCAACLEDINPRQGCSIIRLGRNILSSHWHNCCHAWIGFGIMPGCQWRSSTRS
jgi:hypothetical protein